MKLWMSRSQIKDEILTVFYHKIADTTRKLNSVITELFIRRRKLNFSFVFKMQSCFEVPRYVRLNSANYFIMKIPSKRDL